MRCVRSKLQMTSCDEGVTVTVLPKALAKILLKLSISRYSECKRASILPDQLSVLQMKSMLACMCTHSVLGKKVKLNINYKYKDRIPL